MTKEVDVIIVDAGAGLTAASILHKTVISTIIKEEKRQSQISRHLVLDSLARVTVLVGHGWCVQAVWCCLTLSTSLCTIFADLFL